MNFSDQGRARVEDENRGEMLGLGVEHLAHLLAYAVRDGSSAQALRDRPFCHPTVEEGSGLFCLKSYRTIRGLERRP